jgi:hypothetical protein
VVLEAAAGGGMACGGVAGEPLVVDADARDLSRDERPFRPGARDRELDGRVLVWFGAPSKYKVLASAIAADAKAKASAIPMRISLRTQAFQVRPASMVRYLTGKPR